MPPCPASPRVLAAGSRGVFAYAGEASALLRGESSMAGAQFGSELRYSAAAGMRFDRVLVGPELVGAVPLVMHELAPAGRPRRRDRPDQRDRRAALADARGVDLGALNKERRDG